MKYGFIERQRSVWPVRTLCRLLQVSHGGFYTWVGRTPSHRALANERLTGLIRQSFAQSDRTYGSPRVWRDLLERGVAVGENPRGALNAPSTAVRAASQTALASRCWRAV